MNEYKLVPVKPTPEMVSKGARLLQIMSLPEREAASVFRAMLAAAPDIQREPVGYVSPLLLDALRSGKTCGITMEDKPDTHNGVTIPLYAAPQPAGQQPKPISRNLRAVHAMILSALDRDAADGKAVRGEMAAELRSALSEQQPAPAVQGEPTPAGFALIKLDSRTGKPLVTSEMKVKHIGEYWWDEEAPYYDEHGDLHDYVARHVVPWSLCKEIYKSMASTAMLSVRPAEQQPAPAVQGEPVGWQFYQDGKWWYGDDRIKLHRKNTEAAGMPARDLYAAPQPAPDVTELVEAMEKLLGAAITTGKMTDLNRWSMRSAIQDADTALCNYRKQGGEV